MKRLILLAAIFIMIIFSCLPLFAKDEQGVQSSQNTEISQSDKILICSAVFSALGKIGEAKANGILYAGLKNKDFFIRIYAIEALGLIGDKQAIPYLANSLNDNYYVVKISAAKALFRLGDVKAEEALKGYLNDQDPKIRYSVLEDKVDIFKNQLLPVLLKIASDDNNPDVKSKAIEQLGLLRCQQASDAVLAALENENPQIRKSACYAAGRIGIKKAIPLLIERLGDSDIGVRSAAKEGLGILNEKSLNQFFWQDIEDKDPIARGGSFIALAHLKDTRILPILLKEIISPEIPTFLRQQIARALNILKPGIEDFLTSNLAGYKEFLSLDNLEFDYKINGKALTLIFLEALQNKNDPLHKDAAFVLKELNNRVCLPGLREALFDSEPGIISDAAFCLGEFRDKNAVDDLIKVYSNLKL